MNVIDQLCAVCSEEGVERALRELPAGASLAEFAEACWSKAKQARERGSHVQADHLFHAAQYLAYLELPYALD